MIPSLQVLFIDNYDSFTFNLVDEMRRRRAVVEVWRNDLAPAEALERALALPPPRLVLLSPGPGAPASAGCCEGLIRLAAGKVPVFGVCLGLQCIVTAFGGEVGPAGAIVHGKADTIVREGDGGALFSQLPPRLRAGRYHSLAATRVPAELRVTARCGALPMAVEHRRHPVAGVQFHPESILTPEGGPLLAAVNTWARAWHEQAQSTETRP